MVRLAYGLGPNELSAPDWMDGSLFDLSARLPKDTTWDQFQTMFKNLLSDRFKLAVHRETKERTGYQLLLAKGGPKFNVAPPELSGATGNSEAALKGAQPSRSDRNGYPTFAPGQSGTRMSGSRARMYQPRMTMNALAAFISATLHEPVTESTGLTGSYEISLYWSVEDLLASPSQAEASPPTDPGPTLLQALQKQLGLRLVRMHKVPFEVLVVDHAEKLPTPN